MSCAERTEKLSLGSIKTVVSEPIDGQQEYHIMVCHRRVLLIIIHQSRVPTDLQSQGEPGKFGELRKSGNSG